MNMELTPDQPRIDADGFVLRPLRRSDAGLIALYAGDARVARMTRSIPHPFPPGAAEALIQRAQAPDRAEDVWALDASASGGAEVMGLFGLERLDRAQSEVGFWVAPAFWNTGVASAALKAVMAANPHQSQTLFAEVFQDNPASARVMTNAGFAYLGDAETFSVARGAKVATWTYTRKLS
ncbi:Protein N-acetyltransferase, RimJ/RimL family [Lutimaribacter pacificus]|uniref:Protein N-acetyltransferase, RimJ/RimL family n=1 Tax=Lutimaribacter pacificus TaxID=391948 RepID=A0A1H0ERK2_9RHOB|nr:GNAT family protein [Lutimaribacter pacificus]SDN84980.1 Protein N-acetyltransferase, RimJ/RimL family [Lutimaribacter pacificus]SHK40395.1 Protein N-acetyltransferase, RimJ/RimL family [Lutimaribacter pacificus]